ncbi:MAG: ankyrin repeat domain-containing protein, partial [Gammaproteobacteria bacterium]|nr:ankyrin repeat domain-containing protein [Gammaproteobacteria bacterium]
MIQNMVLRNHQYKNKILQTGRIILLVMLVLCPAYADSLNEAKQFIRLKQFNKAHKTLNNMADKGNSDAQYYLAVLYRNGHGIEANAVKAYQWFHASAQKGNIKAQYELGMLYKSGIGTTKNNRKAYYWLNKAAAGKHRKASLQLETMKNEARQIEGSNNKIFSMAVRAIQQNDINKLHNTLKHITINQTDNENNSLLHHAALQHNISAAKLLLKKGIHTKITNNVGNTALAIAASKGNIKLVQLLIKSSDINHTNKNRQTPVMLAAKHDHEDIVSLLINNRANLNIVDSHGL